MKHPGGGGGGEKHTKQTLSKKEIPRTLLRSEKTANQEQDPRQCNLSNQSGYATGLSHMTEQLFNLIWLSS